jgi:hypothetical protein
MTNWAQQAEHDIQKLDKLHTQLKGTHAFIQGDKNNDAELTEALTEALATVSEIKEPPHGMLLTPLLEYAIILADGFSENRETRWEKLSDLVVITSCQLPRLKEELRARISMMA